MNCFTKVIVFLLFALIPHSSIAQVGYWPDMPKYDSGEVNGYYTQDPWPDSSFVGVFNTGPREMAYPYHSGIVEGINDTIEVWVTFRNRTRTRLSMAGYLLHDWIIPAVYDINTDLRGIPAMDTSDFKYSFQTYSISLEFTQTAPDSIFGDECALLYHLWDIPPGRYQVRFFETSLAPPNFDMLLYGDGSLWITDPTSLADTICAFAKLSYRARMYGSYTVALSWADSILNRVPNSIVGWRMRAQGLGSTGDSSGYVSALDSVIIIGRDYRDGILPDSSTMNKYQHMFLNEMIRRSGVDRYYYTRPPDGRTIHRL